MIKPILSFDLDMTLVDHKTWQIPASTLDTIHSLRERFLIVIATGRNLDDLLGTPYKKMLLPDAIIHLNGSRIAVRRHLTKQNLLKPTLNSAHSFRLSGYQEFMESPDYQESQPHFMHQKCAEYPTCQTCPDYQTCPEYQDIYHHTMSPDIVASLLTFADSHSLCIGMHQNGMDYFTHPHILEQTDRVRFGESHRNFADSQELLHLPVYSLTLFGDTIAFDCFRQSFPNMRLFPFSNGMMADISEKGISKASAMRYLVQYWNTDLESVIAFGDDQNDLELLQSVGIGVAMGNACQEVKEAADYVTADIDQDGILKACRHLHLL